MCQVNQQCNRNTNRVILTTIVQKSLVIQRWNAINIATCITPTLFDSAFDVTKLDNRIIACRNTRYVPKSSINGTEKLGCTPSMRKKSKLKFAVACHTNYILHSFDGQLLLLLNG